MYTDFIQKHISNLGLRFIQGGERAPLALPKYAADLIKLKMYHIYCFYGFLNRPQDAEGRESEKWRPIFTSLVQFNPVSKIGTQASKLLSLYIHWYHRNC